MNFSDWKANFGHHHITINIKAMLDELKVLEEDISTHVTARYHELKEFERRVEKMLVAEWELFLAKLEGEEGYN